MHLIPACYVLFSIEINRAEAKDLVFMLRSCPNICRVFQVWWESAIYFGLPVHLCANMGWGWEPGETPEMTPLKWALRYLLGQSPSLLVVGMSKDWDWPRLDSNSCHCFTAGVAPEGEQDWGKHPSNLELAHPLVPPFSLKYMVISLSELMICSTQLPTHPRNILFPFFCPPPLYSSAAAVLLAWFSA